MTKTKFRGTKNPFTNEPLEPPVLRVATTEPSIIGYNSTHPAPEGLKREECVEMSSDGSCVLMLARLKDVVELPVQIHDVIQLRWFHPLTWQGREYLASVRTGSLFDRKTGKSNSPFMRIVK